MCDTEQTAQRVRSLFQLIPGVGDVEEGGEKISCYGGTPTDLLEQSNSRQAFLMQPGATVRRVYML